MRFRLPILAIALLMCLTSLALAEDRAPQSPTDPQAEAARGSAIPDIPANEAELKAIENGEMQLPEAIDLPERISAPTPLMTAIQDVVAKQDRELADLNARYAQAGSEADALAIQAEIRQLKRDTELEILAIQVRHARAGGDEELALRIETAIDRLVNPPAPPAPANERPAPVESH